MRLTDGRSEVILSTADGQAIRFEESEVRPMGRSTYGVRGMTLDEGGQIVSIDLAAPGASLLAVAEKKIVWLMRFLVASSLACAAMARPPTA